MKKVSIIIVNFNTKKFLRECLLNLTDKYENKEIIVVDNASTDGSAEMIHADFPSVTYIQNSRNVGLAAAANIGLKAASGDYLLYLGTDALPEAGTVEGMVAYMDQNPKVGIATCKLVLMSGELDMDAHRGFPTPWTSLTYFSRLYKLLPTSKVLNGYFMGNENIDIPHEIDLCITHFMLIRQEVFAQVGTWDEDYFVFGEDVDMCYRAKQAGWKIMYLPQFKALHHKGASIGVRKTTAAISPASAETKAMIKRERARARKLFYTKHLAKNYSPLTNCLVNAGMELFARLKK